MSTWRVQSAHADADPIHRKVPLSRKRDFGMTIMVDGHGQMLAVLSKSEGEV